MNFPIQLLLAGPGDEGYVDGLKEFAADLGVADITLFLGMVYGEQKRSLFQLATSVCSALMHQENFWGWCCAEAPGMRNASGDNCGTDIWQELEDTLGGEFVEHSPEQIADAIASVVANQKEARRLGEGAGGSSCSSGWTRTAASRRRMRECMPGRFAAADNATPLRSTSQPRSRQ